MMHVWVMGLCRNLALDIHQRDLKINISSADHQHSASTRKYKQTEIEMRVE